MTSGPPFSALARAVAQGSPAADLVPELHREALALSGGTTSVILERAYRTGDYVATSGRGFPTLAGVWLTGAEARALETIGEGNAAARELRDLPTLAARLGTPAALIVPVAGPPRPAYLVIGGPHFDEHAGELASRARLEFGLALELARLARQAELHQKLQDLFLRFSRGVAATLSLGTALETVAQETNVLFGTRRTRVWMHDRRARELVLAADSGGAASALGERVPTDSETPAARGLRRDRPLAIDDTAEPTLVVPLRGWRRALGTLVLEGPPQDLDDRQFEQAAYELGRQLSVSVENVQLLEEVLQHRRLLEDTFNSLVDLVVVVDANLRVVQINEAFTTRVGAARTSLMDRPVSELVGAEMAQWIAEDDRARGRRTRVAARTARTQQFTDTRLHGTFSTTITPLLNQDGEPVGRVLVARDITTQLRLESEREALRERLGQSEKLASLGQFVAGIAHEMNNPLQGVLGHLELLMETSPAAKPLRRDLRRIYLEGDRAAKIVRNLLVFAGKRRAGRERVRIDRIIARAISSQSAVLRRSNIQVVRQQDPAFVPVILGDGMLLQQAFLNILVNASHAIVETGGPGRIEIAIERNDDAVVTRIRDSGAGIPADVLPRIFDPFFTTKDVGQGTGLGLAIVYGIVQEHGGTIAARNLPDGGAEFSVTLPAFKV
jgi:PAS domain S-box-containing protein